MLCWNTLTLLPETRNSYHRIAEAEEGINYFRTEAALDEQSDRLRPGMRGIGKTAVDDRLLIRIWTNRLVDWIRLTLWKWWP